MPVPLPSVLTYFLIRVPPVKDRARLNGASPTGAMWIFLLGGHRANAVKRDPLLVDMSACCCVKGVILQKMTGLDDAMQCR